VFVSLFSGNVAVLAVKALHWTHYYRPNAQETLKVLTLTGTLRR